MASEHDRAVLQAIFHPGSPLGDTGPALNSEEELTDDGETPLPIGRAHWAIKRYPGRR